MAATAASVIEAAPARGLNSSGGWLAAVAVTGQASTPLRPCRLAAEWVLLIVSSVAAVGRNVVANGVANAMAGGDTFVMERNWS